MAQNVKTQVEEARSVGLELRGLYREVHISPPRGGPHTTMELQLMRDNEVGSVGIGNTGTWKEVAQSKQGVCLAH